jgi:hypothetical protein
MTEHIPYIFINDEKLKDPEVDFDAFNIFSWQLQKM